MKQAQRLIRVIVSMSCLMCMQAYAAGRVELVTGNVSITSPQGQLRIPQRGERIVQGEAIVTGSDGEVHLHMDDNALVAVRPATTLKIDAYVAEGASNDQAIFRLLRGTFRSITGWIGKADPKRYEVRTPTATIGIRGTDHEPAVVEAGEGAGTYDKVNEGGTVLENAAGRVEVSPGGAAFVSGAPGSAPQALPTVPPLYRPTANETAIEAAKEELARTMSEKLKQKQLENATRGPVSTTSPRLPAPGAVREALVAVEQIFRAIETGDTLLLRTKMEPSMIGFQRILDDVAQEANRCKQMRIHAPSMQAQVGSSLAVVQVAWEKRCLALPGLVPTLASGHTTLLLHLSKGAWSLAAVPPNSMFTPTVAAGFAARPIPAVPTATATPAGAPAPAPAPNPNQQAAPTGTVYLAAPGTAPAPAPAPATTAPPPTSPITTPIQIYFAPPTVIK